ncbi:MAG: DUF3604 domain-containing protein [Myxococcota bacterium]
MRVLRWILGIVGVGALCGAAFVHALHQGWLGHGETRGQIVEAPRAPATVARRVALQRQAAERRGVTEPDQILFGDLHVHTTFSTDAFLMSLPLATGTGSHPPADACDFARYCSQLDFWSINDHAEQLSPRLWRETIDSIRECDAAAGDPDNPDLVSFLGWEWSQIGVTPRDHYGHKNVVLRGLADDEIPARPIAARGGILRTGGLASPTRLTLLELMNGQRGRDFAELLAEASAAPPCQEGLPERQLAAGCHETAATPGQLFAKLRDWDLPAIVIPHGTAWGLYTPPGSTWAKQVAGSDPDLERLVEVYSGHGNSEEYRPWRAVDLAADGHASCPEPTPGYLPSCWRAGSLVRERCLAEGASRAECEQRAAVTRRNYTAAGLAGWRTVPGTRPEEWLDAGQCRDCFLPAFNLRPGSSVQYMLAKRSFAPGRAPRGLRFGMIASSDLHTARPGPGYKEFGRGIMTEGMGRRPGQRAPGIGLRGRSTPPASRSVPLDPLGSGLGVLQLFEAERGASFFLTGGLVAAHAAGRSRGAIWDALERKNVYATSGPRILLWFDLEGGDGVARPMGSSVRTASEPRFRVRAVGSFEQLPGCDDDVRSALGTERLQTLCRGECYRPSDTRRPITRIEVVRIRPQTRPDEPIASLVEDPWKVLPCPADSSGCEVTFRDPDFAAGARDSVYYVRAIEAPSLAIHANPLRCSYDAQGRCTAVHLCGVSTDASDDCLDSTEERAWSSPIFLDFARASAAD